MSLARARIAESSVLFGLYICTCEQGGLCTTPPLFFVLCNHRIEVPFDLYNCTFAHLLVLFKQGRGLWHSPTPCLFRTLLENLWKLLACLPMPRDCPAREYAGQDPVGFVVSMHITPYGRTMTLDLRTPWSRRCIRDTQSSASCLDIPPGIWPHQWRHQ